MVDSEDVERSYNVTTNALQDFTSATSNVHKNPERITVSGTLVSSVDLALAGSVGFAGLRADLIRVANLEELADARQPIMVVSPRVSMARAFIESISRSWNVGFFEIGVPDSPKICNFPNMVPKGWFSFISIVRTDKCGFPIR